MSVDYSEMYGLFCSMSEEGYIACDSESILFMNPSARKALNDLGIDPFLVFSCIELDQELGLATMEGDHFRQIVQRGEVYFDVKVHRNAHYQNSICHLYQFRNVQKDFFLIRDSAERFSDSLQEFRKQLDHVRAILALKREYAEYFTAEESKNMLLSVIKELWIAERKIEYQRDEELYRSSILKERLNLVKINLKSIVKTAVFSVNQYVDQSNTPFECSIDIPDTIYVQSDANRFQRVLESCLFALWQERQPYAHYRVSYRMNSETQIEVNMTAISCSKLDDQCLDHLMQNPEIVMAAKLALHCSNKQIYMEQSATNQQLSFELTVLS